MSCVMTSHQLNSTMSTQHFCSTWLYAYLLYIEEVEEGTSGYEHLYPLMVTLLDNI